MDLSVQFRWTFWHFPHLWREKKNSKEKKRSNEDEFWTKATIKNGRRKEKEQNNFNPHEVELSLEKDYELKMKDKLKQRNQKLLAEFAASVEKSDAELSRLRHKKAAVQRKRTVENQKVVHSV